MILNRIFHEANRFHVEIAKRARNLVTLKSGSQSQINIDGVRNAEDFNPAIIDPNLIRVAVRLLWHRSNKGIVAIAMPEYDVKDKKFVEVLRVVCGCARGDRAAQEKKEELRCAQQKYVVEARLNTALLVLPFTIVLAGFFLLGVRWFLPAICGAFNIWTSIRT